MLTNPNYIFLNLIDLAALWQEDVERIRVGTNIYTIYAHGDEDPTHFQGTPVVRDGSLGDWGVVMDTRDPELAL